MARFCNLLPGFAIILMCLMTTPVRAQQCSAPDATISSSPISIWSCDGKQEVTFNGVDQVYSTDAGPIIWLNSESFGFPGSATSGTTGAVAWTHVTANTLSATSFEDIITMTPSFAMAGQSVDLVQTISYAPGTNFFEVRWDLTNNTSTSIPNVRIIHGCDVLVQGDDGGDRGDEDWSATRTIGCWDDSPAPPVFEGFSGLRMIGDASVSAMHYYTLGYSAMWTQCRTGSLPDTYDTAAYDQGVAILYERSSNLDPGATWTVRNLWTFDLPPIAPPLVLETDCLPCAAVGQSYSRTITATGGIPPYSWAALSSLPPGLSIDPVTGELSGVLSASGAFAFTLEVTDSDTPPSTDSVMFNLDGTCSPPCSQARCGDCNDDYFLNIGDALIAVQVSSGLAVAPTGAAFTSCDVHPDGAISVLDGLWIAQALVGLRTLDCCSGATPLERNLTCGQEYCGTFATGDPTNDISDQATTHYFALTPAMPNASYRVSVDGTADISLFVGAVGTALGDTSPASYTFSDTTPGATKSITVDSSTTPDASLYWGGPLAVAVHAQTAGDYTVTIDCICYSADITATGQVIADTSTGLSLLSGSCGGAGFQELVYTYEVTTPGNDVTITTDNPPTSYDTVLYVTDGCTGMFAEYDCNDDSGAGRASTIVLPNAAPGIYYIIVDGNGTGEFELTVTETPAAAICAGTIEGVIPPMGPWPHVVSSSTAGADDTSPTTCASGTGPDHVYEFSPAETGLYEISLCAGTLYDSVLEVRLVDCAAGSSVACNDNSCLIASSLSSVQLDAGYTYYIIIDGGGGSSGPYSMTINPLGICNATVEADVSGMALPISYSDAISGASDDTVDLACSAPGTPDAVIAYTPATSGYYDITTCGSAIDTALGVFAYHCEFGDDLGCASGDTCGAGGEEILGLQLEAGITYYVVVEAVGGSGAYQVDITYQGAVSCGPACAGTVDRVLTGTALPIFTGFFLDPMMHDDTFGPASCATGGIDYVFEWTPPADASYTISLCGSLFDTILEIRECNCDPTSALGRVVGCNDDSGACGSTASQLTGLSLRSGVVYYIVVDDNGGAGGAFLMNITSP